MNIDKRLESIVNEIDGDTLVDVGCDHGKVTFEAIKRGKVKKVIATDISQKSLDKCVKLINKANIQNVDFRCGDGLDVGKGATLGAQDVAVAHQRDILASNADDAVDNVTTVLNPRQHHVTDK